MRLQRVRHDWVTEILSDRVSAMKGNQNKLKEREGREGEGICPGSDI